MFVVVPGSQLDIARKGRTMLCTCFWMAACQPARRFSNVNRSRSSSELSTSRSGDGVDWFTNICGACEVHKLRRCSFRGGNAGAASFFWPREKYQDVDASRNLSLGGPQCRLHMLTLLLIQPVRKLALPADLRRKYCYFMANHHLAEAILSPMTYHSRGE